MRSALVSVVLGLLAVCSAPAAGAGHEAVPLNDYSRLGQGFTVPLPCSGVSVTVPSWMDDEGGLTLTLWESPQRRRRVAQQVFTAIRDNAVVELVLPRAQPPGTYYWEVSERTGQSRVGLYADQVDADTADCAYLDGVPDPRRRFLFSTAAPPLAYTDPAQMIAILTSTAPMAERQEACRLLAVMGDRTAIPVLAQFLADDALAYLARNALEGMPEAAVDSVFREALATLSGPLRVGLINSIGVRRDAKAVRLLVPCLRDPDPAVAAAAAAALGRIGTTRAVAALERALEGASERLRPALWEGCLDAATRLAAAGHARRARAVYDRLLRQETTAGIRAAAVRGAICSRGAAGPAFLLDQLRGTDTVAVSTAFWVVQHELPGTAASQSLAAALSTLPDERQVALTQALCVRADPVTWPALLELARSGPKGVRLQAIAGLPYAAGSPAVARLVELLDDPDDAISAVAQNALAGWPGQGPDSALSARLDSTAGKRRLAAIQLVGARRLSIAVPGLLRVTREPDPTLRLAALRVLGDLAGAGDLSALLELLANTASPEDGEAIERALRTACGKAADPEVCAGLLAGLLPQAQSGPRQTLLRLLHGVGGAAACQAVLAATDDGDAEVSATAFRLLGEWHGPDVVPHLLRLAETSSHATARLVCLRGCIRLAGNSETPAAQRLDVCRRLVPLAQRDEEKKLLLGVVAGLSGPEALTLAQPGLDNPGTRAEAAAAILTLAEPLLTGPAAAQARQALQAVARSVPGTEAARRAEAMLPK